MTSISSISSNQPWSHPWAKAAARNAGLVYERGITFERGVTDSVARDFMAKGGRGDLAPGMQFGNRQYVITGGRGAAFSPGDDYELIARVPGHNGMFVAHKFNSGWNYRPEMVRPDMQIWRRKSPAPSPSSTGAAPSAASSTVAMAAPSAAPQLCPPTALHCTTHKDSTDDDIRAADAALMRLFHKHAGADGKLLIGRRDEPELSTFRADVDRHMAGLTSPDEKAAFGRVVIAFERAMRGPLAARNDLIRYRQEVNAMLGMPAESSRPSRPELPGSSESFALASHSQAPRSPGFDTAVLSISSHWVASTLLLDSDSPLEHELAMTRFAGEDRHG